MNEGQLKNIFSEAMRERVNEVFESFIEEKKIPSNFVNSYVVERITDEQTELGFNDFLSEKNQDSDYELEDGIRDYLIENYDDSYLILQFEGYIDEDKLTEDLQEELVLNLINTEPYGYADRTFWYGKARSVSSLEELAGYVKSNDLLSFVEKYAEDWEEIAQQNQ
ncbi:hypothetical protein ACTPGW_002593 [Enterococcus faecalis]